MSSGEGTYGPRYLPECLAPGSGIRVRVSISSPDAAPTRPTRRQAGVFFPQIIVQIFDFQRGRRGRRQGAKKDRNRATHLLN